MTRQLYDPVNQDLVQLDQCDETWTPLLDQGLVEVSGRLLYLLLLEKGKAR